MTHSYRFDQPKALDDWAELKAFWGKFKESQYGDRILVTLPELESYFVGALVNPTGIGLLRGYMDESLVGLIAIKAAMYTDLRAAGNLVPSTFIAGVYVRPYAGFDFSDRFFGYLGEWSKVREHTMQFGNARLPKDGANNYKLAAVGKRYGFKLSHMVVDKEL